MKALVELLRSEADAYSWDEFKNFVNTVGVKPEPLNRALYRGQAKASWGLVPTLQRMPKPMGLEEYLGSALPEAYRRLAGHLRDLDIRDERDQHRLMATLQHHGFPTPLLDWTASPYIAAYFAASHWAYTDKADADFFTVWRLSPNSLFYELERRGRRDVLKLISPDARDNPRLLAQDGLFTLSLRDEPLDKTLEALMEELEHPGFLKRFDISIHCAQIALHELALMGVHHGSLFPGLDGLCQRLKIEFFGDVQYVSTPRLEHAVKEGVEEMEAKFGPAGSPSSDD